MADIDGDYSLFISKPYLKHKDGDNDGIFVKIKRDGEGVEREIAFVEDL